VLILDLRTVLDFRDYSGDPAEPKPFELVELTGKNEIIREPLP
jgi:hypothetical protein